MINRRRFLTKQMGIAVGLVGICSHASSSTRHTIKYSSLESVAAESDWMRLRRLMLEAGRNLSETTVVLDQDIRLIDGDTTLVFPIGVELVPPSPGSVTIDLTHLSEPLQRLFLMRSSCNIGAFNIEVGTRISSTVIDILTGTMNCNVNLDKIVCSGDDPIAFGVWIRGQKNKQTTDIDVHIGYSYGLRTGVQIRDCHRVCVRNSEFDNYGHRGVHAVSDRMDTTDLTVINCEFGHPAKVRQSDGYSRQPIGFNASSPFSFAHRRVEVRNCVMRLPGLAHDSSAIGKATRSRASADGISLHRAVGFRVTGNEVIGSGELAINASGGSSNGLISHNRTENDDVGAINVGVLIDNTGVNRGGIRNSNILVSNNSCFRSVSNALGASAPDGKAALRAYSSDDCNLHSNRLERHENRVLAKEVAAIGASASAKLSVCGNRAIGFDRLVNVYVSNMGTGIRDVQWLRSQTEKGAC